jgi:hypothetical protein
MLRDDDWDEDSGSDRSCTCLRCRDHPPRWKGIFSQDSALQSQPIITLDQDANS